ncbi:MAG TPA: cupin domain-containing protein [Burkholderiales bacterium]|nr:cupin domain-containing protein [Burkholderiales bacterium]
MSAHDTAGVLGGCPPRRFLARHWQKTPLVVRAALPGFTGLLSPAQLFELACREDAQCRLVVRRGRRWKAHQGPFQRAFLRRLPARGWTLLVHEVERFLPEGRALLERFSFVPYARLDDLMVSYAPPGGGVGPHCDSYDVFLLQGRGRRRWRVSHQRDNALVDGAPLRLLRDFRPQQEWVLEPGDMLYLPPGWAHDGVALEPCMTYSIGFRAPVWRELAIHFLRFLEDQVEIEGMYRDPELRPQNTPARIGRGMVRKVAQQLATIRWSAPQVARFLGQYLTEPKAHVFFTARRGLSLAAFAERIRRNGVCLDLCSQMLYVGDLFFINGEAVQVKGRARESLSHLADTRRLNAVDTTQRGLVALLHEWYGAGYLGLRARPRPTKSSAP